LSSFNTPYPYPLFATCRLCLATRTGPPAPPAPSIFTYAGPPVGDPAGEISAGRKAERGGKAKTAAAEQGSAQGSFRSTVERPWVKHTVSGPLDVLGVLISIPCCSPPLQLPINRNLKFHRTFMRSHWNGTNTNSNSNYPKSPTFASATSKPQWKMQLIYIGR
jgi:hypothetical protein